MKNVPRQSAETLAASRMFCRLCPLSIVFCFLCGLIAAAQTGQGGNRYKN